MIMRPAKSQYDGSIYNLLPVFVQYPDTCPSFRGSAVPDRISPSLLAISPPPKALVGSPTVSAAAVATAASKAFPPPRRTENTCLGSEWLAGRDDTVWDVHC